MKAHKSILMMFLGLSFQLSALAQMKTKSIEVSGGYSKHGSGDYKGMFSEIGYWKNFKKKLSWGINISHTINDGKDPIIIRYADGSFTDASVRFTTAGVQVGGNIGLSPIKNKMHEVRFALGVFCRYQSASNGSDGYVLYSPLFTGQPTVLIGYDNRTPQRTIAAGGILRINYFINISKSYYAGINQWFQTDTNGDAILIAGLSAGRRF